MPVGWGGGQPLHFGRVATVSVVHRSPDLVATRTSVAAALVV
jgi:hypothetical protein